MSLIDEARSQLDAEVTSYIRAAQQPYLSILPSSNENLLSLGTTLAKKSAVKTGTSTAAVAATNGSTSTKSAGKCNGGAAAAPGSTSSNSPRAGNHKQARARLLEVIKKLQRAIFVAVQVSKDEAGVEEGSRLSRRGSRVEGLSRRQSAASLAVPPSTSSTAFPMLPPSAAGGAMRSKSSDKAKQPAGGLTNSAAAARTASAAATMSNAAEKRADMRETSPHLPPRSSASLGDTQRSHSFRTRHRDTERSHSTATSAMSRERSGSPNSATANSAANTAQALRRLEASLMFAKDCLHYASTFAEAGLAQEAQACFLMPIAQEMANVYDPIVARCVERRPRSETHQLHQQQQQQREAAAAAAATAASAVQDPRRRRASKGKARKDSQKHNMLSLTGEDASSQALLSPTAPSADDIEGTESTMDGGIRKTDDINVFANDVPLPLALRVYKCVLQYRALTAFIRFGELLKSDVYGDAAGMSTSVSACACVEELVTYQQRVLHTVTFCAATVLHHEEARIREDVAHTAAAKPINAIVVAGGCRMVDLVAEPTASAQPGMTSLSLTNLSEEPPVLLYPVDEVAAPVLFTMRRYVAMMCEQLFDYVRSTTTSEMTQTCGEVRTSVYQRCLEALRASVSMSELHLTKAALPTPSNASHASENKANQQQQQKQQQPLHIKTCLPLASVEFLPWRLQEYTLMQHGYLQMEDGTAAAVTSAENALQQVLQLVELEYLDPVPPPNATMLALDAAVQQCASLLLVATWHAAVAQGSSSVSTYLALSGTSLTSSLTQAPPSVAETVANAAAPGGDLGASGGDAPPLHMAATARTAMTAITAAVQQAVAYLVTSQWGSPTSSSSLSTTGASAAGGSESMPRRGSRRGGPNSAAVSAAPAAGGVNSVGGGAGTSDGSTPPAMTGTRLLVVLWTCAAHVQQQCTLLAGRTAVADALASAAKDTEYTDVVEGSDSGMETLSSGRTAPPSPPPQTAASASSGQTLSKSPSPRKANPKAKPQLAATPTTAGGDGVAPLADSAGTAVPAELRHAHPAVASLARQFPRMAVELLLQLVGVVEAAGAVPQAQPYTGATEGKRETTNLGSQDGVSRKKSNESPEQRSARSTRRRASSVAVTGDAASTGFNPNGSTTAIPALSAAAVTAAFKLRALQCVYRGCVEALEVLLHAAAVKATDLATYGAVGGMVAAVQFDASNPSSAAATQGFSPLSVLTRTAVWNDAVEVLGYCDETEAEGEVIASQEDAPHAAFTPPSHYAYRRTPATPSPAVCFLFNPADTRCVLRWVSWAALFVGAESDNAAATGAVFNGGSSFSSKSLAEAAMGRAVTALRIISFASPRFVVAVRVGLAMEAWCRAFTASPAGKAVTTTAKLAASTTVALDTTKKTTAAAAALKYASSMMVEAAVRCVQLLRALLLASLLQRSQQQSLLRGAAKRESPLNSMLRLFEVAAHTLDVVAPPSRPSTPAPAAAVFRAPSLTSFPAGEVCQPEKEHPTSSPPLSPHSHSEADEYAWLAAQAKASLQLSILQRRTLCEPSGHTVLALREHYERHDAGEAQAGSGDAWTSSLPSPCSMGLYKASAVLVEKVTAALCPVVEDSGNNKSGNLPPTPSPAAQLLKPITIDAGSFLLRCGEALRAQWQQVRTRHLLQRGGHDESVVANISTIASVTASAEVRGPSLTLEEHEAQEESHYATIVWCVLSFLWHSSGSGGGAPPLDERGVASITRRVSAGFLQLLPGESGSDSAEARIAPVPLVRLLAHGTTVRRLLELTRSHLQAHVESLLRHANATSASSSSLSVSIAHGSGFNRAPLHKTASHVTAAQQASQHRSLVAARDGLTELTYTWVTVRWQLARLQVHHADYSARHIDLDTLQQRHDQYRVYGRPTAKELRILQMLEQDAPLLPATAKDEEVRLKRWVKDHQHAATGTTSVTSCQLLEALVCAALVPLNTADPSAQQKLVEEAIRALTDAEKSSASDTGHRPGSSSGTAGRSAIAHQSARHSPGPIVVYTPILLWCYLAEACSRCGTAEQTALVRGVLDRHLLTETPEISKESAQGGVSKTAPFVLKLLLQPRWAVLEGCSSTTRLAFCRALSALASRAVASSSATTSALSSLQSAYRLLLALQIQQLPDSSAAVAAPAPPRAAQPSGEKKRADASVHVGGHSDAASRHGPSSKLTLSSAQQLFSAITEYLTRSSDTAASGSSGSPAAALLLPLLVELCNVLLHLPSSSPEWGDGEMQLFALRVLILFKQQQLAVLAASPSPLNAGTAAANAPATAASAVTAAATMMDAFLQLLWTTFAHVWNSVFCNPTARQRCCINASAHSTKWARRVFGQHCRRSLQAAAGQGGDADGVGAGTGAGDSPAASRHGRSPRKGGAANSGHSPGTDGVATASAGPAAVPAAFTEDEHADLLTFAGVAYLPARDQGSLQEEERPPVASNAAAAAVGEGESPERHRATPVRPKSSSNHSSARSGAGSLPSVLLHAHMPCEYLELLEDLLFHLPPMWPYVLSPPGAVLIPAVSAATNRSSGDAPASLTKDTGRAPSPHPAGPNVTATIAPGSEGSTCMYTQYDFVHYAAQHAVQALREWQRSASAASAILTASATGGERQASTPITTVGLLCGVPPIYIDVVAALQQYSVAMSSSAISGNNNGNAGGSGAAPSNGTQQSAINGAGVAPGGGNPRTGNARAGSNFTAAHPVSAACQVLMETLHKHKEDPAYVKLAVRVVREMLDLCCDEGQGGAAGGGAGGAAAGGGGNGGATASNNNNNRKKNVSGGGAAAGGDGPGSGGRGGVAGISAAAVTADVHYVIRSVRERAQENHRAIRAFLSQVDAETDAWLTRSGFDLVGQAHQQQQAGNGQGGGASASQSSSPASAETASGNKAKTAAAASAGSAGKKANKKGAKKTAGGKGGKAGVADTNGNDEDTDDDEANQNGRDTLHQAGRAVPYTTVTRVFSFPEEQKLKQLTCGVARWRRRRAGQIIRRRYVQFNTPFLAQLHLMEAVLLYMAASVQRDVAKQKRVLREVLRFTEGTAEAPTAGEETRGLSSSPARASPRDKKKSVVPPPSASTQDDVDVGVSPLVTEELLRHCVCASNLFQNVWLPVRASAAVQLAVSHLRKSHSTLSSLPLPSSAVPHGKLSTEAALVSQLLTVPLFSLAAVQHGYYDARRDVHTCVLQPTVVKVGADVSWPRRNLFICTVPSLFSLTSAAGLKSEAAMTRLAQAQARQQRRYELLQLSWCIEEETETRAEAVRDELQNRVRIIQMAQQYQPPGASQTTSLRARLVSAAELLALAPEKGRRKQGNPIASTRLHGAGGVSSSAAAQGRESFHAAAAAATAAIPYSPFDGARGGPRMRQAAGEVSAKITKDVEENCSTFSADAGRYGPDMAEAFLVDQLTALAHELEREAPKTCIAAYRAAQQLTGGRYAIELLPRLMQMEDDDEDCGRENAAATTQAYEKALRGVSDGVWLLRTARNVRRQMSTHPTSTHSSAAASGKSSCKVAVEAYQRAAKALRSAGLLQLLGECLYEMGNLYCAAGQIGEAERNWMDALDCFLSTPHVLDDWHTQRTIPPPPPPSSSSTSSSSCRRSVEELLWMMAALTALAEHAYATNTSRSVDAQLLCALLVHQYWHLPAVVSSSHGGGATTDSAKATTIHTTPLPPSAYSQLDVATLRMHAGAGAGRASATTAASPPRATTAMPDSLVAVLRALIHSADLLAHFHFSGEAAVLGAFSDFVATVHLRQVKLAVKARLVRAMAAAELGSFSVAMRHLHSVCVGAGLPQPASGLLNGDSLQGYYSISAAMATAMVGRAGGELASTGAVAGAKKSVVGQGATPGGVGGGTGAGGSSSAAAQSNGGGTGAASLSGAAATVLPATIATFFYLYRDHESPSSPHNTAAVRAFVLACLPGLAVDSVLPTIGTTGRTAAASAAPVLALSSGLLASSALETLYGVPLLRKVCVAIADVLVRLGTCDPVYLFRPSSASPAVTMSARTTNASGPQDSAAVATSASAAAASSSGTRRRSSASATQLSSYGGNMLSLSLLPPFTALAGGERPTNACTEACRYAQVLLQSLRSADVRFALTVQSSTEFALDVRDDLEGGASGRATRTAGEAAVRARVLVGKDIGDTGSDSAEHDSAEQADCVVCLNTLGAIRQRAIILSGEVLAAQGQYSACLQLLTSVVAEFNAGQTQRSHATPEDGVGKRPAQSTRPAAVTISLRDFGVQGGQTKLYPHCRGASVLPTHFTYVYWAYVWQLMCRCYCSLRQYAQLENAAGTHGLQLCDVFGDTNTYWCVFQLYRLYALTQMGRLKEAGGVAEELQRAAPLTPATDGPRPTAEPAGITDDGTVAAALQWWQIEHSDVCQAPRMLALSSQRVVAHLTKVAVAERGVLPWHTLSPSSAVVVLESPNAHAVVPACPVSGFAKTRDVWLLHAAINRCAVETKWQPSPKAPTSPSSSSSVAALDRTKNGSTRRRSPQPLSAKRSLLAGNAPSPAPQMDSLPTAAVLNGANLLLKETLEGLCPQYTVETHPSSYVDSCLVSTCMKAAKVRAELKARQQQLDEEGEEATVEFAVDDADVPIKVASEVARAPPTLNSRDAALRALPPPVREVCAELLRSLQHLVQYPVQRHLLLRFILLSIAGVLSTYTNGVRHRCRKGKRGAASAEEEALLPQLSAILAACTLLAGLVSDMERRARTGADSFRGYFTDPRLSSSESGETLALLLESQWPESLCTAVQQTHANVGQLQTATTKQQMHDSRGALSTVLSHPFYALPAVQQQILGVTATATGNPAGGAPGAGNAGGTNSSNSGGGGSGRGGSAGSRDQAGAGNSTAAKRAVAQSSLLSVPTLALTFTALADEAPAAQMLTPVCGALEHDVALQLLISYLQALSPPVNCTYLCYRDDVRQQLLEAVSATLNQQQQLQQQQQQQNRAGQRRTSNAALKRPGGIAGASSGTAGASQSTSPASGATALAFSEADIWKALLPPVMLSAVPAELFSALGPDTLGAPLYNSVAAAALEVIEYPIASPSFGKKTGSTGDGAAASTNAAEQRAGESPTSLWQLFLAVSPLNNAGVGEPLLPTSSSPSPTLTAASSPPSAADAAVLLPPAHLVAAVNGGGGTQEGGTVAPGITQTSTSAGAGVSGASAAAAASRGRGGARPSGVTANAAAANGAVVPQRRSSGQDSGLCYVGSVWPPMMASAPSSSAACLVPSTNWIYLEQIQQEGLSALVPKSDEGALVTAAAVKPISPAAAGNRAHPTAKAARGTNAGTIGSVPASVATTSTEAAAGLSAEHAKSSSPRLASTAQSPAPLRWSCVSLELSVGTMQVLRRHLQAVQRCMHLVKGDACTGTAADAEDTSKLPHDNTLLSKTTSMALDGARSDGDSGRGEATRAALAAAVSRAQQTLRSHLAAAGMAASNVNNVGSAGGSGGIGVGAGTGGGGSAAAAAVAAGGPAVSTGASSAAAGAATGGAGNTLSSTTRKSAPRLAGTAAAAQRASGSALDSPLPGTTAHGARESGATHDDLTEAVRARQTAQRERQRQQYAEELEEAKASLLRELLEAIVSGAAGSGMAVAVMDEARVEADVQRLMPHCAITPSIVDFLCDWLGGVSAVGSEEGSENGVAADAHRRPFTLRKSHSGHTSMRFYNAGLHAWMQRIAHYVATQQQ